MLTSGRSSNSSRIIRSVHVVEHASSLPTGRLTCDLGVLFYSTLFNFARVELAARVLAIRDVVTMTSYIYIGISIYIYVVQTTPVVRPFVPTKLLLFLSHSATLSVERLLNTKCGVGLRCSPVVGEGTREELQASPSPD